MAGLPITHTAVGRLTAALQREGGCTTAEAVDAYGPGAKRVLEMLTAEALVGRSNSRPVRWQLAVERLSHTELRELILRWHVKRQGELGCTVADLMQLAPESRHRTEMALQGLIRAGQVERFRPTEGDRRVPRYRAVTA